MSRTPAGEFQFPGLEANPGRPFDEVRATDPVTGGQKGRKAVRPDLIPEGFVAALAEYQQGKPIHTVTLDLNTGGHSLVDTLDWLLTDFWDGADVEALLEAASLIEYALGGWVATRAGLAKVYGLGALKYDDDNWRKGYPWSWSYQAARRHLQAVEQGQFNDPESGEPHLLNVWWHLATLWTFQDEELGTDDRPRKEVA